MRLIVEKEIFTSFPRIAKNSKEKTSFSFPVSSNLFCFHDWLSFILSRQYLTNREMSIMLVFVIVIVAIDNGCSTAGGEIAGFIHR